MGVVQDWGRSRRRTVALAAVLVLAPSVAGACGRDDTAGEASAGGGPEVDAGGAQATATTGTASSAGAPTTTAPRTAPTTGRTTRRTTPTAAPTTATPPDDGETQPGRGDVQPTAADDGSQGPPGAFARTLLRPTPATTVVFERFAQRDAAIADSSIARTATVVRDVTGKPVDVRSTEALDGGAKAWTADEIRAAADDAASVPQGNGRAVIRILQLRGTFEGSDEVLGVAVRGDTLALFPDSIAGAATPLVSAAAVEDAVVLHELGHLLGLVDLARNTGRADPDHAGHSRNPKSVMYWAVESSVVGQVLNGPPPREFDAEDLADLRALRNGA